MAKLLTIEDLRTKSNTGYRFVQQAGLPGANGHAAGPNAKVKWRARSQSSSPVWHGPRRATPKEAAQDYCDHANAGKVVLAPQLITPGHKTRTPRNPDDLTDAERQLRAAQRAVAKERGSREETEGFVYCIGQADLSAQGKVKIGWAEDPELRLGALQPGNPNELYVIGAILGYLKDERALHAKYIKQNVLGEWFRPTIPLLLEFDVKWNDYLRQRAERTREAMTRLREGAA